MSDSIALRLLGGLEISRGALPIDGFVSSRGPALVAYLSATGRAHTREHLAGLLWSEVPEKDARASLRVVLSNLRQTLGAEHFAISWSQVALRDDTGIQSDAGEFVKLIATATDDGPSGQAALERAGELYGGEFFAGFSVRDAPLLDEWIAVTREWYRNQARRLFERLVELRSGAEQHEAAIITLERLLAIEPWHETAFRQYMTLLALTGRRTAALVEYDSFTQLLDGEFGTAPDAGTVALYEQIRNGAIEAASPSHRDAVEPANYPPPRETRLRNPASSFVGRRAEMASVGRYLRDPAIRLISLVGPGGSGKTRLALQVLKEHAPEYDGLVAAVPLASVTHSNQIFLAVLDVLEVAPTIHEDPLSLITRQLGESRGLLLLDNFEHLLDGADVANQLLDALPSLCILVTSRERLALQAEWVVPLAGLPVPEDSIGDREARNTGAMRLFIDRARQMRPDFLPDNDELQEIAIICRYVEGLPLGIELAASWMRTMECAEIAAHVQESLDFLSTIVRDVPARHRSLRAVFDRSWALLDERAQRIFASLSVFANGFTADSARAVTGSKLQDLMELLESSLIRREESGRYILHELLRQYAGGRLDEDPDFAVSVRDSHAIHFADLIVEAETLLTGSRQSETLRRIEEDRSNLSSAWGWMLARRQYQLIGAALDGVGLFHYLDHRSIPGLSLLRDAVRTLRSEPPVGVEHEILLGRLYGWQAHFFLALGQVDAAEERLALAEELVSRHARVSQLAYRTDIKGRIASTRGNFHEARRFYELSLGEAQQSRDRFRVGVALNRLGGTAYDLGNLPAAREGFERSIAARREIRDWEGMARDLNNLADVAREAGDYELAQTHIEESMALHRERGSGIFSPTLETRGHLALHLGQLDEAAVQLDRCMRAAEDRGDQLVISVCMLRSAELALMHGDWTQAEELLSVCGLRFEEAGFRTGIVEWGNVRSRLALVRGQPAEALRYARASLNHANDMGNVLRTALARGAYGRALLNLGHTSEAASTFKKALRSLKGSGALPAMLDLVVGVCRSQVDASEAGLNDAGVTDAADLAAVLAFVRQQQEAWYLTKNEAGKVLEELESTLDSKAQAEAREHARSLSLDSILSQFAAKSA